MVRYLRNIKQSSIVSWNPKKPDAIFGKQNNAPLKKCLVLILRNYEYDTLHGRRNFASMITDPERRFN